MTERKRIKTVTIIIFAVIVALALTAGSAIAAISFVDPSFENGGSTTMVKGTNYNEGAVKTKIGVCTVDTLDTDIWWVQTLNVDNSGGILENKNSHVGFTDDAPKGVNGQQFYTVSRGAPRGAFQYVEDGGATTGEITFLIDYWAHEIDPTNPIGVNGDIKFEVIAFNDPCNVIVNVKEDEVIFTGEEGAFITTCADDDTKGWQTVATVDAATGFQPTQVTLDLGTGYQYIGVYVGSTNFARPSHEEGKIVSFDNLRVIGDTPGAVLLSPLDGATVAAGDVVLEWLNDPQVSTDVWVDVWFGTDPAAMTKELSTGLNATTYTVSAPVADTYYWRVDSYLGGSPTGTPVESELFEFIVIDTDSDGFPDEYELLYTDPASNTALNPGDDLEHGGAGDGLTNWQEYMLGTDPTNSDSDGDGLEDGPEVAGVGNRPPTDPADDDTDGDGLNDHAESNTGIWVNAADTGTDPTVKDTDGDGLTDAVESNTGSYVGASDTGTSPLDVDSDNDNAEDWYEVAASYTDPTDADKKPSIPYPLPAPDPADTGVTDKPVKVYIMSGQSNMVGYGRVYGGLPGTLETITGVENKFPNLVAAEGGWTTCNDVYYRGVISDDGSGALTPDVSNDYYGPEIGFGYAMGWYHDEPVLLIKSSIGNRSLRWDILPPSSAGFDWTDKDGVAWTYAGYGQSPPRWETGTTIDRIPWYAGKQFDDFFLDEADMFPAGHWANASFYKKNLKIQHNGIDYKCKSDHTSSADTEPGVGSDWETYWEEFSVFNVVDILDNFATEYPQWAGQGFEIAGYVWWQGHKDQSEPSASRYEQNLVQLIKDVRSYYENRYPANTSPNAPFVLATIAFNGWELSDPGLTVANAQLAVSGETGNYPEFEGNVKTIEARGYWREIDVSPATAGFHYNHNAETYMLTGDALGRAMVELSDGDAGPAGADMITWSGESVELDATVADDVIVESYAWSAAGLDPNVVTVVFDSNSIESPEVTITKPEGDAIGVTIALTITAADGTAIEDSMKIDVYDSPCKAAIAAGLSAGNPGDINQNCITDTVDMGLLAAAWLSGSDLQDFAEMAKTWLDDYTLTEPVEK